jgi:Glycosyl transferase family 2/Dolichyl-phosphate-mannose-protein mannosyltransferase
MRDGSDPVIAAPDASVSGDAAAPTVSILALTLNEIDGVKAILPAIDRRWADQILVIDGGSTDGTVEWCREQGYEVYVQKRPGIRFAYLEALDLVRGDLIVSLSPDGNCDPAFIPAIIAKLKAGYDLVIGSRYLGGARSEDDDLITAFGNWLFTATVNVLHGATFTDVMVIYRGFTKKLIYALDLQRDESYALPERLFRTCISWEPLMSVRAAKALMRISELAVGEPPRIAGKRKLQVLRWGAAYYFQFWRELVYWAPAAPPVEAPAARNGPGTGLGRYRPLLALLVLLLCLALRVAHLDRLPVFIDEAIHISQAREAWSAGAWLHPGLARYLPTWINALGVIHTGDPLRALRLSSAVWGTLSAAGLVVLGRTLGQSTAGLLAALLYAVVPYTVVHDRMGLVDPLFTALVVWSAVVASAWRQAPTAGRGVALGLLIGGMLLTKPYGAFALATPFLFVPYRAMGTKAWPPVAVVLAVAVLAATPLWIDLGVVLPILASGQGDGAGQAFSESTSRLAAAWRWHVTYLTPVGAALAVVALLRRALAGRTPWPVVSLWVLWGPVLALALALAAGFAEFPRHLLPSVPLLLYIVASEAVALSGSRSGRIALAGGLALWCLPSLVLDHRFAVDPQAAPIAPEDHWQYVAGWPAGYGLPEVSARLQAESRSGPLLVIRDSYWVPLSVGLDVYVGGAEFGRAEVSGDPEAWAKEIPRLIADDRPTYLAREVESGGLGIPVLDLAGKRLVSPSFLMAKPDAELVLQLLVVNGPAMTRAASATVEAAESGEVPESVADARRGVSAALAGAHADAARWLWRAHRVEPSNLTIRYDLGVVLAALGPPAPG